MFLIRMVAGALLLTLLGCAAQTDRVRGTEVRIRYAEVVSMERVKQPSAAPAGAMVGGFTGLVLSRHRSTGSQIASGIGGAALGALATRALEGERLAYSYRLRFMDDSESDFITEKGYLQTGDCVSVERGEFANVRRVAQASCRGGPRTSPSAYHLDNAEQCYEAKKLLLAAASQEEVDAAARKVEILCDF